MNYYWFFVKAIPSYEYSSMDQSQMKNMRILQTLEEFWRSIDRTEVRGRARWSCDLIKQHGHLTFSLYLGYRFSILRLEVTLDMYKNVYKWRIYKKIGIILTFQNCTMRFVTFFSPNSLVLKMLFYNEKLNLHFTFRFWQWKVKLFYFYILK